MSGIKVSFSLFSTNLTGQDLYTGGVFGAERSILILCVVFILIPNHSYLSQLDVTYKTPDLM
ncbi:hypothetical protein, partial [Streptococcus pneumoniae]